jgi:hypothetical protein
MFGALAGLPRVAIGGYCCAIESVGTQKTETKNICLKAQQPSNTLVAVLFRMSEFFTLNSTNTIESTTH